MSTQVIIVSNMAPPGLKRRSMMARGVTGATGAMKGGLGGGLKGGAKGAAIGGALGSVVPGAGTLIGAGVGGAVGAGVGALRGAGRGAARGFRKFKKAPSIADQTYNERNDSMKTVTIVNNSEQRRVQTQMTLNRLNASLEPIEMITENSLSRLAGRAVGTVKKAGRAFKTGSRAGYLQAKEGGVAIGRRASRTMGKSPRAALAGAGVGYGAQKVGAHVAKHGKKYAAGAALTGAAAAGAGAKVAVHRRKKK